MTSFTPEQVAASLAAQHRITVLVACPHPAGGTRLAFMAGPFWSTIEDPNRLDSVALQLDERLAMSCKLTCAEMRRDLWPKVRG